MGLNTGVQNSFSVVVACWLALTSGNLEWSLKEARHVMRTVQGWPEEDLPNRNEVLANLHSCIGNALMDLGKMDQALTQYQKSLQLAIHR